MEDQDLLIAEINQVLEENFAAGVSDIERRLSCINVEDLFKPFTI